MAEKHKEDHVEVAPEKPHDPTPAQQAKVDEAEVIVVGGKRFIGTQRQAEEYASQTGQQVKSGTKAELLEQGTNTDALQTIQQLRQ